MRGGDAVPTQDAKSSRPTHVAIIMDGNGRWAADRGLPRAKGHHAGVEALRRTLREAANLGVRYLTLFSFSSENWSRPQSEVTELMQLLRHFIRDDLAELTRNNVRVRVLGRRDDLRPDILELVEHAERETADNDGLFLQVAFNYGARDEIVRAAQALARDVASGRLDADAIDEEALAARLDTAGLPEPDLLIRTSGEQRISNFLLWQCAYTEFVFLPIWWPDFDRNEFLKALDLYARRERRFGGLVPHPAE
ncbi:isoprenyl transferase [Lutibaculum baratangense]|uniref:Isoprenyl transferase n=1 Tax=Lutibaculum baratangense AMV1 TaxID=631454 RepID=V4RBF1_9HYPH|nr:isoprenyl transferase [Lutibaculum baratangense]ESR23466.1 Undecaprenyl pyrophosphate synthetase [Lutibaculum baratangense AMV1]